MSADGQPAATQSDQPASSGRAAPERRDEPDADTDTDDEALSLESLIGAAVPAHLQHTSVVQYLGPSSSYCGYCKRSEPQSGKGRRSYDMQTYTLRPHDYQALMDRNWRRCGLYTYCPINHKTCCPNYPIICTATDFHLTRSQRKCIAKVNKYLATGSTKQDIRLDFSRDTTSEREAAKRKKVQSVADLQASSKLRAKRFLESCERRSKQRGIPKEEAADELREKWNGKLQSRLPLESYLYPKRQLLVDPAGPPGEPFKAKHSLRIDMVHVQSARCVAARRDQHRMLVRYQEAVHKDSDWSMSRFCNFLVDTPLITEGLKDFDYLAGATPDKKGDPLSADPLAVGAHEFLLARPPQLPTAYGTYHCNYYLDDKLIATGVLDVLPKCITTVYFFYDPDYGFLNLGIYSALVEISMIRQMDKRYIGDRNISENQLVNYYLGFYVHVCKKMFYKTRFRPAYLLCSRRLCYVPIDRCLEKLAQGGHADFADESQGEDSTQVPKFVGWLAIPVIPPVAGLAGTLEAYMDWLTDNFGLEYLDLFFNGYMIAYAKLVGAALLPRLTMRVNVVHRTLTERHKRLNPRADQ